MYQALQEHPTTKLIFLCESCSLYMRTHMTRSWRADRRVSSEGRRASSVGARSGSRKRALAELQESVVDAPSALQDDKDSMPATTSTRRPGRPRKRPRRSAVGPSAPTTSVPTTPTVSTTVGSSTREATVACDSYAAVVQRNTPSKPSGIEAQCGLIEPTPTVTKSSATADKPRYTPREHCILIFGASESLKPLPQERHAEDMSVLQRVIDKVLDKEDTGVTVKALVRLGSRDPESGRSRPLKVIFTGPEDPKRLLRRAYRLKGEPFVLRPDLSPEDRLKLQQATKELKSRTQNGETDLTIVNFRVVRRAPILRKPLLLKPNLST